MLSVIRAADVPVVTAVDIADELGCTPEAVTGKIKQLQQYGRVARRQVGGRAVDWWLAERPVLDADTKHDPNDPFFAASPLDAEAGGPIAVADINSLLGDALIV